MAESRDLAESVIEVNGLTKEYGDIMAVDGISFNVLRGEIFSLVGPNGAGKTTTVEILECLRKPTGGTASVFGLDVMEDYEKIKDRIGTVPQEFNTFERLTVEENVELVARIYGVREDLRGDLETLGLWPDRDKKFGELSGGMKRRVGIAMALAGRPELLFLDEPTTGLDPQARRNLWGTIGGLKEMGVTIFLTTHYMEEVEELSDRASIIVNGKILSTGGVEELVSKYGGDLNLVVDDGLAREILERYTEDVSVDPSGKVVGVFQDREKAAEAQLSLYRDLSEACKVDIQEPSMEDVFLRVVGSGIDESGELLE